MAVTLSNPEIRELSPLNLARVYSLNTKMIELTKAALHLYRYDAQRVSCLRLDLDALMLEKINLDNTISLQGYHARKAG